MTPAGAGGRDAVPVAGSVPDAIRSAGPRVDGAADGSKHARACATGLARPPAPSSTPAMAAAAGEDRPAVPARHRGSSLPAATEAPRGRIATWLRWLGLCAFAAFGAGALALSRRERNPARMMIGDAGAGEDPRRSSVALCERPTPHRPRRRLRRPVRHLRALSPVAGERRPDGQRHRRAWHADHGRSRQGGSLAT